MNHLTGSYGPANADFQQEGGASDDHHDGRDEGYESKVDAPEDPDAVQSAGENGDKDEAKRGPVYDPAVLPGSIRAMLSGFFISCSHGIRPKNPDVLLSIRL